MSAIKGQPKEGNQTLTLKVFTLQSSGPADLFAPFILDLSDNLLESLEAKELCGLASLASLNLSTNELNSLLEAGLGKEENYLPKLRVRCA